MKIAAILIGLLVTFATAEGEGTSLDLAIAQGYRECEESMKPSEDTLLLIDNGAGKDNKDVQCFRACVMEKAGIRNGPSVDLEKLESLLRSNENQCELRTRLIMEAYTACKAEAEVSDDECEVMGHFWYCAEKKINQQTC